eukprot:9766764-Ditylum_brightwellii.AAC.1
MAKSKALVKKYVIGKGTVRYTITNDNVEDVQLLVSNTYHTPDIPVRLLCTQQVAQQSRHLLAGGNDDKSNILLSWDYNFKIIEYVRKNNLQNMYTTPGGIKASAYLAKSMDPLSSLYANKHALPFSDPFE